MTEAETPREQRECTCRAIFGTAVTGEHHAGDCPMHYQNVINALEKRLADATKKRSDWQEPWKLDEERWKYLRSLKKDDAIGIAFAMLEQSILHHIHERDGWTPDDECYMETLQAARETIEARQREDGALIGRMEAALRQIASIEIEDDSQPLYATAAAHAEAVYRARHALAAIAKRRES